MLERFEAKFIPEPNTGCWLWTGSLHRLGYGKFKTGSRRVPGSRKPTPAHRVAWELYCGDIPEKINVLHRCDVRCCVNPGHLFLGTHLDNMRDMAEKGRASKAGPGKRRGVDLPWTKLTDEQVRAIIADARLHREIAADYGVSRVHVCRLKKGRKRRSVCA